MHSLKSLILKPLIGRLLPRLLLWYFSAPPISLFKIPIREHSKYSVLCPFTVTLCLVLLMLPTLPVPQGEATGMTKEHASEVVTALREKATRHGFVRVMVKVRQDPRCEKTSKASPQSECWNALEATKQQVLKSMAYQDFVQVESMEGLPLLVLEITPHGLNSLLSSELLESIQEDVPERPF